MGPASILKEVEDKESEGEDEEDEDEDLSKYKLDEVGCFVVCNHGFSGAQEQGRDGQCFQLPAEQSSAKNCPKLLEEIAQALLCSEYLHSKMGTSLNHKLQPYLRSEPKTLRSLFGTWMRGYHV